ncbi:hypothetical protein [Nocardia sp. NPDC050710]
MGNLSELAGRDREQVMKAAPPALRAALARHISQSDEGSFKSFIGTDQ